MNNHKEEQLLKQMIEFLAQESGKPYQRKPIEELDLWRGLECKTKRLLQTMSLENEMVFKSRLGKIVFHQ